jgi:hypothetical protein
MRCHLQIKSPSVFVVKSFFSHHGLVVWREVCVVSSNCVLHRLTSFDQPVTNGSSMCRLVYSRPHRLQSGRFRLGCLVNLQQLPTGVLATTPSPPCQRHLTQHLRVDPRIRPPVRPHLFPVQVQGGVPACLRVSLAITMTCETLKAVSTVEVLLALGALARNGVAR